MDYTDISQELDDRFEDLIHGNTGDYSQDLKDCMNLQELRKSVKEMDESNGLKQKELELEKYKAETERLQVQNDYKVSTWKNVLSGVGYVVGSVGLAAVLFKEETGMVTSKGIQFVSGMFSNCFKPKL